MRETNFIDPRLFAAEERESGFRFALKDLDERVVAHRDLASDEGVVNLTLRGGIDESGRHFIDIGICAEISLICQRCLQTMPFVVDENHRVILLPEHSPENDDDDSVEDREIIAPGQKTDVRRWAEDFLLTALPAAPSHERCEQPLLAEATRNDNPFALLKKL